PVTALAFAPDGKTLASASSDTTVLIWDVSKLARPAQAAKALSLADLERCCKTLTDQDAEKAWAAMTDLVAAPKLSVAFLKDRLKPAAPVDPKRVQEWIGQLDDPQFNVLELAAKELRKLAAQSVPARKKTS